MTNVEFQKSHQGYTVEPARCSTCNFYESVKTLVKTGSRHYPDYFKETKKRCGIGGFAVKSSAICNDYDRKLA